METKKLGIAGLLVVLLLLGGCVSSAKYSKDIAAVREEALQDGRNSVDITVDNEEAIQKALEEKEAEEVSEKTAIDEAVKKVKTVFAELYSKDYLLGDPVDLELGDYRLDSLIDDEISVDDKDYDVTEYLVVNGIDFITSADGDEDFEDSVYLNVLKDTIRYEFRFEDHLPDSVLGEEGAVIKFLGNELEIVSIGDSEVTVKEGKTNTVKIGETLNGVTVVQIGMSSIIVDVDGTRGVVKAYDTKTVNNVEVSVGTITYVDESDGRYVELSAGEDILRTIKSGESYDPDVERYDSEWVYDIETELVDEDYELVKLSLSYNQKRRDLNDNHDFLSLVAGEEFDVLGYLKLKFSVSDVGYLVLDVEKDEGMVEFNGDNEETFIYGTDEYKEVFLDLAANLFCEDFDCEVVLGDSLTELELGDTELTLNTLGEVRDNDGDLMLDFFNLDPVREEPVMTEYGIVYRNSEDWVDEDDSSLEVSLPEEALEVSLSIMG